MLVWARLYLVESAGVQAAGWKRSNITVAVVLAGLTAATANILHFNLISIIEQERGCGATSQ